ncbi:E3 ubiquitin-protein ligase itt1 [Pseudocercospora fuligena]|uniref:RBR-type E3 ubiquitin transferase n=1 Tax=Pseudocercospora fuligena TaxID=685502 RepID=A0A8H6RN03_9PEZI|nr:E3 ubiquitin-protein ligase itt1 [Pseudocercospora fuligena]
MDPPEDERTEEIDALTAIFPELSFDANDRFSATLDLPVAPAESLLVRFIPSHDSNDCSGSYALAVKSANAHVEHDVHLSYLPPLRLHVKLPSNYPADAPPEVELATDLDWLPKEKIEELRADAAKLWEEYGQCQILYTFIDHLQQAAERGFDLDQSSEGLLVLSDTLEPTLVEFGRRKKREIFEAGHYDCGICLEPKTGTACHEMDECGHIFCKECLQDTYNNAITEGNVAAVRCLDPSCGKATGRKTKKQSPIHPRELLAIGLEEAMVRRYVDMKRKKLIEADKNTVYCPRQWCQAPAKSDKYPTIPADLTAYVFNEPDEDGQDGVASTSPNEAKNGEKARPDPSDRLAICEKCSFAFCKVCYKGWHGQFARCYPRDPNELSAEEKASYEYIQANTSPCANCNAPVQKTMGCNHMNCFNCRAHFCYLCGSWLDPNDPYKHFNTPGKPCYQRLWELEEGDEGQGPEDGRGFGGGRGWEQLAIEAARNAEEAEAEEVARNAQAEENARAAQGRHDPPPARNQQIPIVAQMDRLGLDHNRRDIDPGFEEESSEEDEPPPAPVVAAPRRGGRRQRNPFPARPPANGVAAAVRNHERAGRRQRGPAANAGDGRHDMNDRQQEELQRFLELARNDEEDGWDSDDLGDDEEFVIRDRR